MRPTGSAGQPLTPASGGDEAAQPGRLANAVYKLDAWLRRRQGVVAYSADPDCIFRIQIQSLDRAITLADGTCLAAGVRIITLHVWNEQVPLFPKEGLTLKWARALAEKLRFSMQELARYVESRPDLGDIEAIRGEMTLGPKTQTPTIVKLAMRYGFEPVAQEPVGGPMKGLHRLGENILITMLVLARNPAAWGWDDLARDKAEVVMSRAKLMRLHGPVRGPG